MLNRLSGCSIFGQSLFFALIFLISCNSNSKKDRDQQVLLTVNNTEITLFEFEENYIQYIIQTGQNNTDEVRYKFLNQWIDNILLAQEGRKNGLTQHPETQEISEYELKKATADVQFVKTLEKLTPIPNDDELRLAFAKSKRKVYVRHLYSRDKESLLPYYEDLKDSTDFIEVANKFYNTPTYDSLAGYLGPINYFGVDDAFAETAFSLNKHEFSEPIRSNLGWHIIWVEEIIFEALLTESEYQTKKGRVTTQLTKRKANLVANTFIRDKMRSLNISLNRKAVDQLSTVLSSIENDDKEAARQLFDKDDPETWNRNEIDDVRENVDLSTTLATFDLDGEQVKFEIKDYLDWLPALPYRESKYRIGASIGRALRNEYFFREGLKENIQSSFDVTTRVRNKENDIISQLMQYELISDTSYTLNEPIPGWFINDISKKTTIELSASYTIRIPKSNSVSIKELSDMIKDKSYLEKTTVVIDKENEQIKESNPIFNSVKNALIGKPMLSLSSDFKYKRFILTVESRTYKTENTLDYTIKNNVSELYRRFKILKSNVDSLRNQSEIRLDTTLIMNEF